MDVGAVQPSSSYTFPRPEARIRPVSHSFLTTLSPAKPFFFSLLHDRFCLRFLLPSSVCAPTLSSSLREGIKVAIVSIPIFSSSFIPLRFIPRERDILSTICICVRVHPRDRYKRTFFFLLSIRSFIWKSFPCYDVIRWFRDYIESFVTWFQNLTSWNNGIRCALIAYLFIYFFFFRRIFYPSRSSNKR